MGNSGRRKGRATDHLAPEQSPGAGDGVADAAPGWDDIGPEINPEWCGGINVYIHDWDDNVVSMKAVFKKTLELIGPNCPPGPQISEVKKTVKRGQRMTWCSHRSPPLHCDRLLKYEFLDAKEKIVLAQGAPRAGKEGSFLDSRDGRTYRTVTWDNLTWFGENLQMNVPVESVPYDLEENNVKDNGRLYTFLGAFEKGLPEGWRLPTLAEWQVLVAEAGTDPFQQLTSRGRSKFAAALSGRAAIYRKGNLPVSDHYFEGIGAEGLYWCRDKERTFVPAIQFDGPGRKINYLTLDAGTFRPWRHAKRNVFHWASVRPVKTIDI